MYFNPLFMQTTGTEESVNSIKQLKLNKNSYLFSDIIKLNYEKSKVGKDDLLSSTSLTELNSSLSGKGAIDEVQMLNNLVGMPTLEMLTVVDPKLLNSLVEKVFQSDNSLSTTGEMFALNKQSEFAGELKSEIYGSEEKLVEFLEQLLPGMVLVDNSKPTEYKLNESSTPSASGLNVLPLPESDTVITDVLNRLKLGQTVQITAKVDEEKIKLTIQKVSNAEAGKNLFVNTISEELAAIEEPELKTTSVDSKVDVQPDLKAKMPVLTAEEKAKLPMLTAEEKTTLLTGDLPIKNEGKEFVSSTNQNVKIPDVQIKADKYTSVKTSQPIPETDKQISAEVKITGETNKPASDAIVENKVANEVAGLNKFKTETILTSEEKISLKVSKPLNQSKEVKVEGSTKPVIEGSKIITPEKEDLFAGIKAKLNVTESSVKENKNVQTKTASEEVIAKAMTSEGLQSSEIENVKIALQSKSFTPLKKKETESKTDKYKIEITQEKDESGIQKTFKNSKMEVDNLLNFRKQSEKVDNNLNGSSKPNNEELQTKNEEQKISASEETKTEVKIEKPTVTKNTGTNESVKTGGDVESFDKALKNASNLKEVVKTVRTSQILQEVKTFVQSGEHKTLVMKLVPETLGEMKVTLDIVDNQVKANIEVENETVKQMIMANLDSLKQSITQSGVQVSGFNITLTQQDQKAKREYAQKKKEESGNNGKQEVGELTSEIRERKLGYNTYEFLA